MMMKSVFWWRKPEYPEETTDLRQVTDETFHTCGLCPARGLNLGRSGVKQSELRRDESGALAHRATAAPQNVQPCLCDWVIKGFGIFMSRLWYVQPCLCDWVIKGLGMSSRVCVTG